MKKYLSLAVVFLTATALGIAFQRGLYGLLEASVAELPQARSPRSADMDRSAAPSQDSQEGACLVVPSASPQSEDFEFARLSADLGRKLLARARQNPSKRLLAQAAAHFRASLIHEAMVPESASLFEEVRASLASIDREMAHLDRPGIAKATPARQSGVKIKELPTEPARVVVKKPEPSSPVETTGDEVPIQPKMPEVLMFGPDGVPIRRVAPTD